MKYFFLAIFIFTIGCTTTGVIPTGKDSYMIARDGGGLGTLKAKNLTDANIYCKDQGKVMQATASQDLQGFAASPNHSELQFMCLNDGDSRLKNGTVLLPIQSRPAVEIINNH